MLSIEKKLQTCMESSLKIILNKLHSLRTVLSPSIANTVTNIPKHAEEINNNNKLIKHGILNTLLCLNAQTKIPHTEKDISYTIISVPNQTHFLSSTKKRGYSFEFHINEEKVLVVPLAVGSVICYSGFLLTHRQHITNIPNDTNPFLNIVSYNSKRLFSHILKSIERNYKAKRYYNFLFIYLHYICYTVVMFSYIFLIAWCEITGNRYSPSLFRCFHSLVIIVYR